MEPLLLDKTEACRVLCCGNTKLHELIAARQLDVVYIGRATRITTESLKRYVASLAVGQKPEHGERMRRLVRGLPASAPIKRRLIRIV